MYLAQVHMQSHVTDMRYSNVRAFLRSTPNSGLNLCMHVSVYLVEVQIHVTDIRSELDQFLVHKHMSACVHGT